MATQLQTRTKGRPMGKGRSEEGYILVWVIFLLAILTLSLSIATPRVIKEIERDREVETMQRGKQYRRAVQLYFKRFGRYPPTTDALEKTNEVRYLRKKYTDPTTGKEEWHPVLFGQNKAPVAMGFFGEPMMGTTMAGIGPSGGNGLTAAGGPTGIGSGSSIGGSSIGGSSIGGSSIGGSSIGGSSIGGSSIGGSSIGGSTIGSPDAGNAAGPGGTLAPGGGSTGSGSGTSTGGDSSTSGQTFGGAGIIGFTPNSTRQSILVYKKMTHFSEWEFTYDPIADQMQMMGGNAGTIGNAADSTTTPIGSSTTPTGTSQTPGGGSQTPSTNPNQ